MREDDRKGTFAVRSSILLNLSGAHKCLLDLRACIAAVGMCKLAQYLAHLDRGDAVGDPVSGVLRLTLMDHVSR